MIQLFNNIEECSGCSACQQICPQKAIQIKPDKYGFTFPEINYSLCIECGKCLKVCPFKQTNIFRAPIKAYAAVNESSDVYRSSSGGAFFSIASEVIKHNGVVFGVAWDQDMVAVHQMVSFLYDLQKLQGSKYVQSDQKSSYSDVKNLLRAGTEVLYTGTPCQIAGLKQFLGRDYENLYTTDIICHGVPSEKMHTDYVRFLEEKYQAKITNMNYREKSNGWSLRLKIEYEKKGSIKSRRIENNESYYYNYFMRGLTYRESCYHCPFARFERVGDLTLGDYWGIEKYHPDISTYKGVSAVLVNDLKGLDLIKSSKTLTLYESKPEWVISGNAQLRSPTTCNVDKRKLILDLWKSGGAKALNENHSISLKQKIINKLVMYTPYIVKNRVKNFIKKNKDIN